MKYELTTSISAKCGLLTSKVNFVVTIAFRYALCATYFITQAKALNVLLLATKRDLSLQRSAHLLGAAQRDSSLRREIQKLRQLGTQEIRKLENQITGEIKSLRSKQGLRLCSLRRNSEGL